MKEKMYEIVANHCDQDCIDMKCTYCEENVDILIELFKTELKTKLTEEIKRIANL